MSEQNGLLELRNKIDSIDEELIRLISERGRLAAETGKLKRGKSLYHPGREAQVLRKVGDLNSKYKVLSDLKMHFIFREIMSACLSLEEETKVAFLGPEGSFSHQAAIRQFGQSARTIPLPTIDECIYSVEREENKFAIAPIENSTEGAVNITMDLLAVTDLKICAEIYLRIEHNLLRKIDSLEDILRIYSHPQSFAQCYRYLKNNFPNIEQVAVSSNSEAARLASQDERSCAIAGSLAAGQYDLFQIKTRIEDKSFNTTRFIILGKIDTTPTGKDKTSIICHVKNEVGALNNIIVPISQAGVSMTSFQSRPNKNRLWEYDFYIDLEGHKDDSDVASAIKHLGETTIGLKIVGSYPVASKML